MTEEDRNKQRTHWQELAEQLGLEPEGEPTGPPASQPAAAADKIPSPPEKREEEPEASARGPALVAEESLWVRSRGKQLEPETLAPQKLPQHVDGTETIAIPPATPEAAGAEQTTPTRRRRTRRSAKRSTPTGSAEESPLPAEPDRDSESSREKKRGRGNRRGRGRSKASTGPQETAVSADDGEGTHAQAAVAEEPDTDNNDVDALADWNVPSWTDLIASLYRPDH